MKYIVLHREGLLGDEWMNHVGNSLHVPLIDAESPEEAVEKAIDIIGGITTGPPHMCLVLNVTSGGYLVSPHSGWKVDRF
jgi:hypothetical protein